jgi:hypothetical protein
MLAIIDACIAAERIKIPSKNAKPNAAISYQVIKKY